MDDNTQNNQTATQGDTASAKSPQKVSLIKTPFSIKGEVSSEFDKKQSDMVAQVNSEVFDTHTKDIKEEVGNMVAGVGQLPKDKEETLAQREERLSKDVSSEKPDIPFEQMMKQKEAPSDVGGSILLKGKPAQKPEKEEEPAQAPEVKEELAAPVRDKEALRKDIVEVMTNIERLTAKQKSLKAEALAVVEKKKDIITNRQDLEAREKEVEKSQAAIVEKIKESLSATEKRKLEEERWALEEERQKIERERWEYDQAIETIDDDVNGIEDELSTNTETLTVATRRRQKLEFELKKIEATEKSAAIEQKIKEIEALREQVVTKQKELRDEERKLTDSADRQAAKEKEIEQKIKETEDKEHSASDSNERHAFEKERWDLEKSRKAAQELLWKIEEEKNGIEDKRLEWSKRDEKFATAINQLKTEKMQL